MSHDLPPVGFEPHDRKSPLTAPWEPIYRNAQGAWVVLGVHICAAHTNSRGLVHGGLVAALLDNAMGLACGKALQAESQQATNIVTVSLGVEYLGMAEDRDAAAVQILLPARPYTTGPVPPSTLAVRRSIPSARGNGHRGCASRSVAQTFVVTLRRWACAWVILPLHRVGSRGGRPIVCR